MAWRVAYSLDVLLGQLNAHAPNRSKVSDGSIGDAVHATRDSDHNPWYGPGIVTARDFTHDQAGGLGCHWLAAALTASGDRRIKYIIWNRRLWAAGSWRTYTGPNPHTRHLHLSVVASPACDDITPWPLGMEDTMPLTSADTNAVWMQPCTGTGPDGTTQTWPAATWMTVMAFRVAAIEQHTAQLVGRDPVDVEALVEGLAPLLVDALTEQLPTLRPEDLERIAAAVTDEQARRLAG